MTCREFNEHLDDHLDAVLDPQRESAALAHAANCAHCRGRLARAEHTRRSLGSALAQVAGRMSLQPAAAQRILRASRAQPAQRLGFWTAWHWVRATPTRSLATVAVVGAALVALLIVRAPGRPRPEKFITYSIDVPFQINGHSGVTHAEFSTVAD